ncbi:MAG: type II toxin-antitoxin system VapC family toxin, partial [Nitrospiraceae bacterium]
AVQFGRRLFDEALTPVLRVTPSEERRAWDLFQRYHDKLFSFVDCTSFTLMQRHRIPAAFAFDLDFRRLGHWVVYPTDADL